MKKQNNLKSLQNLPRKQSLVPLILNQKLLLEQRLNLKVHNFKVNSKLTLSYIFLAFFEKEKSSTMGVGVKLSSRGSCDLGQDDRKSKRVRFLPPKLKETYGGSVKVVSGGKKKREIPASEEFILLSGKEESKSSSNSTVKSVQEGNFLKNVAEALQEVDKSEDVKPVSVIKVPLSVRANKENFDPCRIISPPTECRISLQKPEVLKDNFSLPVDNNINDSGGVTVPTINIKDRNEFSSSTHQNSSSVDEDNNSVLNHFGFGRIDSEVNIGMDMCEKVSEANSEAEDLTSEEYTWKDLSVPSSSFSSYLNSFDDLFEESNINLPASASTKEQEKITYQESVLETEELDELNHVNLATDNNGNIQGIDISFDSTDLDTNAIEGNISIMPSGEQIKCLPELQLICREGKCQKTFEVKGSFIKHLESHKKKSNERVVCTYEDCTKTYSNKKGLTIHIKTFHSLQKCAHCTFICQNKDILLQHLKSHKIPRKYQKYICQICGATGAAANQSHHMKTHDPTHPEEVKVSCTICAKPIAQSFFKRHLKKCTSQSEIIRYSKRGGLLQKS